MKIKTYSVTKRKTILGKVKVTSLFLQGAFSYDLIHSDATFILFHSERKKPNQTHTSALFHASSFPPLRRFKHTLWAWSSNHSKQNSDTSPQEFCLHEDHRLGLLWILSLMLKGPFVYCMTRTRICAYKWEAFIIPKQWWGGHGSWSKQRDETQEIRVLLLTDLCDQATASFPILVPYL